MCRQHYEQVGASTNSPQYKDQWHITLTRYDVHIYAPLKFLRCTFCKLSQLLKMHRQFAHPSAEKLYNLLKIAGLGAVDSSTLHQLKEIVASCEPCQRIKNVPLRFRISMGHANARFNAQAYIDIMYLDRRPVLHILDEANRFSAANFLPKISTDAV